MYLRDRDRECEWEKKRHRMEDQGWDSETSERRKTMTKDYKNAVL